MIIDDREKTLHALKLLGGRAKRSTLAMEFSYNRGAARLNAAIEALVMEGLVGIEASRPNLARPSIVYTLKAEPSPPSAEEIELMQRSAYGLTMTDEERVMAALRRAGGVVFLSDIARGLGNNIGAVRIHQALHNLREEGLVYVKRENGKVGRPKTMVHLLEKDAAA